MEITYNVTGSERKALVTAIAKATETKATYLGVPSLAYQVGPITVDRNGTLIWTEEVSESEVEQLVEQLSEAGFEAYGMEDADGDEEGASLDVSVPENTLSEEAFENLQAIVAAKSNLLKKALDTNELQILKLNGEIHFPWFKLKASPEESQAYAVLIEKLIKMAQEAKRVTAKEKEVENEKYAFRCFLLRLGFIGDEYKQARKILLQNLTGNSAFSKGRKEKAECLD